MGNYHLTRGPDGERLASADAPAIVYKCGGLPAVSETNSKCKSLYNVFGCPDVAADRQGYPRLLVPGVGTVALHELSAVALFDNTVKHCKAAVGPDAPYGQYFSFLLAGGHVALLPSVIDHPVPGGVSRNAVMRWLWRVQNNYNVLPDQFCSLMTTARGRVAYDPAKAAHRAMSRLWVPAPGVDGCTLQLSWRAAPEIQTAVRAARMARDMFSVRTESTNFRRHLVSPESRPMLAQHGRSAFWEEGIRFCLRVCGCNAALSDGDEAPLDEACELNTLRERLLGRSNRYISPVVQLHQKYHSALVRERGVRFARQHFEDLPPSLVTPDAFEEPNLQCLKCLRDAVVAPPQPLADAILGFGHDPTRATSFEELQDALDSLEHANKLIREEFSAFKLAVLTGVDDECPNGGATEKAEYYQSALEKERALTHLMSDEMKRMAHDLLRDEYLLTIMAAEITRLRQSPVRKKAGGATALQLRLEERGY